MQSTGSRNARSVITISSGTVHGLFKSVNLEKCTSDIWYGASLYRVVGYYYIMRFSLLPDPTSHLHEGKGSGELGPVLRNFQASMRLQLAQSHKFTAGM